MHLVTLGLVPEFIILAPVEDEKMFVYMCITSSFNDHYFQHTTQLKAAWLRYKASIMYEVNHMQLSSGYRHAFSYNPTLEPTSLVIWESWG